MVDTFPASLLTDEERRNYRYGMPLSSYFKIKIIHEDTYSCCAHFLYKHPSPYQLLESDWQLLNEKDLRSISVFQEKKPFYVTFNGRVFYQVMEWKIEDNSKIVRFSLAKMFDAFDICLN